MSICLSVITLIIFLACMVHLSSNHFLILFFLETILKCLAKCYLFVLVSFVS